MKQYQLATRTFNSMQDTSHWNYWWRWIDLYVIHCAVLSLGHPPVTVCYVHISQYPHVNHAFVLNKMFFKVVYNILLLLFHFNNHLISPLFLLHVFMKGWGKEGCRDNSRRRTSTKTSKQNTFCTWYMYLCSIVLNAYSMPINITEVLIFGLFPLMN
jgi:hypothetical protein